MIEHKKIYIAVLNQGEVNTELCALLHELSYQNKYEIMIAYPDEKPISYNRNKIVQDFLSRKEFDYLLMIDDDIIPPKNILNLADFERDIITPVMFLYQQSAVAPLILKMDRQGTYTVANYKGNEGLVEVDATGTGCMFLSRKILEDPKLKAPFMNEYDQDGMKRYGLDIAFCRRAKKLGYKAWVHLEYVAKHYVRMELKHIYESVDSLETEIQRLSLENKSLKSQISKLNKKDEILGHELKVGDNPGLRDVACNG